MSKNRWLMEDSSKGRSSGKAQIPPATSARERENRSGQADRRVQRSTNSSEQSRSCRNRSPAEPGWGGCGVRAFTLVELLVVITVIGILASLLLPALGRAKARAQTSRCLSNLRQLGVATTLYTQEFNGRVQVDAPLDPEVTWGSLLNSNQPLQALDVFLCPSYPPRQFTNWFYTYGVRQDPPPEFTDGDFGEIFKTSLVPQPSEFLFLADTTSLGRGGAGARQYYYFRADHENEVHARHHGCACGLFLDAHVEACNRARLERLGIQALYGPDPVPGYFPP